MRQTSRQPDRTAVSRVLDWAPVVGGLLSCALVFAVSGCVDDDSSASDPDWNVGSDAGGDAHSTDVSGIDEPESTTFRFENDGSESVWVAPPLTECRGDAPGWVTLRSDGEEMSPVDSCDVCNCDRLRENRDCAVCTGAPCGAARTNEIRPGESVEWSWKGQFYRRDTVDGRSCESPVVPSDDDSLSVEVCWNADESLSADSIQCDTLSFNYGDDQVTKTVRPGSDADPVETTFELQNGSETSLRVHAVTSCITEQPAWVEVYDGGTLVDFQTDCTTCSCKQARSGECDVCERGCAPAASSLSPGQTKEITWDGVGERRERVDSRQCHEKWIPERGEELTAKFCFQPDDPTLDAPGPICRNVRFAYGEDTSLEYVHEDSTQPPYETEFVLHNETNTTIQVEEAGCDEDGAGWFEMRQDGSVVDPATDCTECKCSSVREHGACAVCGRPCEPGMSLREVGPGERETWTWAGHLYEEQTVDGMMCKEKTTPSVGKRFTAEFQWYPEGARGAVGESQTFLYGYETRIVQRVQ